MPGRNTLPYESAVSDYAPSCSSTTGVDGDMSGLEVKFAELSLGEPNRRNHRTIGVPYSKSEVPAMEESLLPSNHRGRTGWKSHRPALPSHWPPGEALSGANLPERLQERRQMASTIQGDGNLTGDHGRLIQTSKTKPDKIPTRSLSRGDTEECQSWQANPMPDKNSAQRNEGAIGSGDSSREAPEDVSCVPRHVITRKAINDPDSLDSDELMELVGAICKAASGRIQSAEAAANFCLLVTQREREPRFIDCLVGWCMEWYNRRDELIPRRLWNEDEEDQRKAKGAPTPYQWTAFVAFLAELLVALTGGGRDGTGPVPVSTDHLSARLISTLLCNCCQIMARWPAKDIEDEMECFLFVLIRAGHAIKLTTPQRLRHLVGDLHETHGQFPDAVTPVSRELRRLRRS